MEHLVIQMALIMRKVLLVFLAAAVLTGFMRAYLPNLENRWFVRRAWIAYAIAPMLGTVTPFCSASAPPLVITLLESGAPLGPVMTYLVATPLINEVAIIMIAGFIGVRVALLYWAMGVIIAVGSGALIGHLFDVTTVVRPGLLRRDGRVRASMTVGSEGTVGIFQPIDAKHDLASPRALSEHGSPNSARPVDRRAQLTLALTYTYRTVWSFILWVIVGGIVAGLIYGFLPVHWIATLASVPAFVAIPAGVLLGMPLYTTAEALIPIVYALYEKGLGLGVLLGFLMSAVTLGIPEFLLLSKAFRWRFLWSYAAILVGSYMLVGFVVQWVMTGRI